MKRTLAEILRRPPTTIHNTLHLTLSRNPSPDLVRMFQRVVASEKVKRIWEPR